MKPSSASCTFSRAKSLQPGEREVVATDGNRTCCCAASELEQNCSCFPTSSAQLPGKTSPAPFPRFQSHLKESLNAGANTQLLVKLCKPKAKEDYPPIFGPGPWSLTRITLGLGLFLTLVAIPSIG